jgi:hypothetical protein
MVAKALGKANSHSNSSNSNFSRSAARTFNLLGSSQDSSNIRSHNDRGSLALLHRFNLGL